MIWLEIFLIVCIIFVFAILGIMFIKKCSAKNATSICRDFVNEILGALFAPTPPPKQYFPTIIGWDGNRILPQLVDAEFHSVSENFSACFCTNFGFQNDDLVMYQFDILRKPNIYEDKVLEEIIQKQTEKIVAKTMHIYDFYLPPEPLTHIELFPTKLYVAVARTEDGIKILDNRKLQRQKRKVKLTRNFH